MHWDVPRTDNPRERRVPRIWRTNGFTGPMVPGETFSDDRHRKWKLISENEAVLVRGKR